MASFRVFMNPVLKPTIRVGFRAKKASTCHPEWQLNEPKKVAHGFLMFNIYLAAVASTSQRKCRSCVPLAGQAQGDISLCETQHLGRCSGSLYAEECSHSLGCLVVWVQELRCPPLWVRAHWWQHW